MQLSIIIINYNTFTLTSNCIQSIEDKVKEFRKLVTAKDSASARKLIPDVYQALDKAVKTGYLKPNTASRTKSRLMISLNKIN